MYTGNLLKNVNPQVEQKHSHRWQLCWEEKDRAQEKYQVTQQTASTCDTDPKLLSDNTVEFASLLHNNI